MRMQQPDNGTRIETTTVDPELGENVVATLDASATAIIIERLVDMYKDAAEATVREYLTNAIDAHKKVGYAGPVQVFLPTELNPSYEVVDHGPGMSLAELKARYVNFGDSDKRDSDDYNGCLGFGCKAALTYVPSFTVTSIKDGMRAQVQVFRNAQGIPELTPVSNTPTTEANGTTITIPVTDVEEFRTKALSFLRWVNPEEVEVDGERPDTVWEQEDTDKVMTLDADVALHFGGGYYEPSYVVMGNVAYPVHDQRLKNLMRGTLSTSVAVIVRVPLGTVEFDNAREGLRDSNLTRDTLRTVGEYVSEAAERRVSERLREAVTGEEAVRVASWSRNLSHKHDVHWQGVRVPLSPGLGRAEEHGGFRFALIRGEVPVERTATTVNWQDKLLSVLKDDLLIVEGFDKGSFSRNHKAKLQAWMLQNGRSTTDQTVLVRDKAQPVLSRWFDCTEFEAVSWDVVDAVEVPDSLKPKRSTSSRSSQAARADDEVRVTTGSNGDHRVMNISEVVTKYSSAVMFAPSEKSKADRGRLHSYRARRADCAVLVVNKNRQEAVAEQLGDVLVDDVTVAEQRRFDALWAAVQSEVEAEDVLRWHRELDGGSTGLRSLREVSRQLGRLTGEAEEFFVKNNHVSQAVLYHVQRVDRLYDLSCRLRHASSVLNELCIYGGAVMTPEVEAWRTELRLALGDDPKLAEFGKNYLTRFHKTYPLFAAISDRGVDALAEYARLLSIEAAAESA